MKYRSNDKEVENMEMETYRLENLSYSWTKYEIQVGSASVSFFPLVSLIAGATPLRNGKCFGPSLLERAHIRGAQD